MEKPNKNPLLKVVNIIKPVSSILLPGSIVALRAVSGDLLYFPPAQKIMLLNILSGLIVLFLIFGGGIYYWEKMRDVLINLKKDDKKE